MRVHRQIGEENYENTLHNSPTKRQLQNWKEYEEVSKRLPSKDAINKHNILFQQGKFAREVELTSFPLSLQQIELLPRNQARTSWLR